MAGKKLFIPVFENEDLEAEWWESRRTAVEADLREAMRKRETMSLRDVVAKAWRKEALTPVTSRRANENLDTASQLGPDRRIVD